MLLILKHESGTKELPLKNELGTKVDSSEKHKQFIIVLLGTNPTKLF